MSYDLTLQVLFYDEGTPMMHCAEACDMWTQFLDFVKTRCSATAFSNWLSPIQVVESNETEITLQIPNIFVKEYLLSNYKKEMCAFLPTTAAGEPAIQFVVAKQEKKVQPTLSTSSSKAEMPLAALSSTDAQKDDPFVSFESRLNDHYRFATYIEGPANQFVKSAAVGVAARPGNSYNPLFIHGGVGLGKTHLLHSIGHHVKENNKRLRVHCITTEAFINQLVDSLRNKSIDRMKRFYRSNVDVLLVDDIQFLQNRPNFEEEFCNTFETLINQNKQIVITCDKPPSQLKLSERMVARMEWGLVASVGMPDLETRVAILQHKAEQKGLQIPSNVAFLIAEHIHNNVRQLEGAINRLSAYLRLLNQAITEELAEKLLRDMFQLVPRERLTVENILKSVSAVFQVRVTDLKGATRTKDVSIPRQVAMFLAKELINESLVMIANSFGKTHSTILHAAKTIEKKIGEDDTLRRQIDMVRRNLDTQH
ncbi:MAG: Chromosomal replication initiator protein DnaA [Chlamydiia bacterium]|nr:Chromosomal replication initiator protein DnaA [Chlamydiia bacterium]